MAEILKIVSSKDFDSFTNFDFTEIERIFALEGGERRNRISKPC